MQVESSLCASARVSPCPSIVPTRFHSAPALSMRHTTEVGIQSYKCQMCPVAGVTSRWYRDKSFAASTCNLGITNLISQEMSFWRIEKHFRNIFRIQTPTRVQTPTSFKKAPVNLI